MMATWINSEWPFSICQGNKEFRISAYLSMLFSDFLEKQHPPAKVLEYRERFLF
jgi:hypothetical protein